MAANPPVLRERIQTWMDPAERMWTQPAVLLVTRNGLSLSSGRPRAARIRTTFIPGWNKEVAGSSSSKVQQQPTRSMKS